MERDQEIRKLTNVLHRVARAAWYAQWRQTEPDAARFCALQFNRIFSRLEELEPAVKPLFAPLPESASPQVIRMAAGELAAYFEDDPESESQERQERRERRREYREQRRRERGHGCHSRGWVGIVRC